jgi:hypothetical protein
MSVDRVMRLHDLEQRWPGPIVAAVYTRSHAGAASIAAFMRCNVSHALRPMPQTMLPPTT